MSIDVLEKAINEVSDKDWSWWPFLWLRPEKHAQLSLVRVAAISVLYGAPCGGLTSIALALLAPEARAHAAVFAVAFPMMLFFVASVFVSPMWNRRAERLRVRVDR